MAGENEKAARGANSAALDNTISSGNNSTPKPRVGTKREKVLRTLVELGDKGLTCFDAVYLCRDYVLRTTICDLQKDLGISIARKPVTISNEFNTHCVRYWLEPAQRAHVAALLGMEVGE